MRARHSQGDAPATDQAPSAGQMNGSAREDLPSPGVLSISPHNAAETRAETVCNETQRKPEGYTASAEVHSLFATIPLLEELLSAASAQTDRLRAVIDEAAAVETSAAAAAGNLHEGLRLGTRMLRAFENEIARLESILESARTQSEQLAALNRSVEARVQRIELRLQAMADVPAHSNTGRKRVRNGSSDNARAWSNGKRSGMKPLTTATSILPAPRHPLFIP